MAMATALLSSSSSACGDDEDGCSICLEPFTSLHPASVTKCRHEYHLQCILEWSLRSRQCPVCLQHLVLNNPSSQDMVAEAERNSKWATTKRSNHEDECIIPRRRYSVHQRRAAAAAAATSARMIMIARRRRPSTNPEQFHFFSTTDPSSSSAVTPADSRSRSRSRSRSNKLMAFSGAVKAKLSTASLRYRESFWRGTRSLKAKILARNDSLKEISRGVGRLISRKPSARDASLTRCEVNTSSLDGELDSLLPIEGHEFEFYSRLRSLEFDWNELELGSIFGACTIIHSILVTMKSNNTTITYLH